MFLCDSPFLVLRESVLRPEPDFCIDMPNPACRRKRAAFLCGNPASELFRGHQRSAIKTLLMIAFDWDRKRGCGETHSIAQPRAASVEQY